MVNNVSHFVNILVNKSLQLVMRSAAELDTGEQVTNQRKEERLVLVDKFRQIHVSQYSHNNTFFCIIGIFTFFSSEGTKDLMKVRNFEFGDLLNSHTSEVLYYLRWRVVSVKTIKFQRICSLNSPYYDLFSKKSSQLSDNVSKKNQFHL